MKHVPVKIEPWNTRRITRAVESVLAAPGLRVTLKGTLRAYPGSVHWHFKKQRLAGTLEVTWWPAMERLWLSVQSGRTADWINAEIPGIHKALEQALGKKRPKH